MTEKPSNDAQLRAAVEGIITQVLRDVLSRHGTVVDVIDSGTTLFGPEGCLDSLGLVSLVVGVEQAMQDELNLSVSLADERALSQRRSPYRNIASLAEYATSSA